MKFSTSDLRILRAALVASLEGDDDLWSHLTSEDMDRADEIVTEIDESLGEDHKWLGEDEDDVEEDEDED